MRAAPPTLLLLMLSGCGVTTHVRPVPPRTLQVEGAVGGPIVRDWGAPFPQFSVGARYGMYPGWDAGLHLDLSALVFGVIEASPVVQAGVETNLQVLGQHDAWPALSLNGRGVILGGVNDPGAPPEYAVEFSPTLSWEVAERWLVFANVAGRLGTDNLSGWAVAAGTRLNAGPLGTQFELRWYSLDTVPLSGQPVSALRWLPLFGRGAIGVVVGVDYQFFGPPPPAPSR